LAIRATEPMKLVTSVLVFCVAALLSLGLVMLYSSSMGRNGATYPLMQTLWCGLGLVAAGLVTWVDYRHLRKVAWPLYGLAVVLLVLVLIPGIGKAAWGARRWFVIQGQSFQPSEVAKLALVVVLAHYGDRYQRFMPTWRRGLIVPGFLICLVLGLTFLEPDWGTTLLLASVSGVMLLVAGVRWLHLVPIGAAGAAAFVVALLHNPTRLDRVVSWLNPEQTKEGVGYQAWQAMLALGSGGVTGTGLGNGIQKYGYVPQHLNDFIFAMLGEELGLVCTLSVLTAFVVLFLCGVYIAWHAREPFGMLLATGLTFLVGLQAFVNIGVVTSALPNKGLPLPFISRGGSNLLFMLVCIGLLLSVARHAHRRQAADAPVVDLDEAQAPQTT
jgi:cell division protein FtsW